MEWNPNQMDLQWKKKMDLQEDQLQLQAQSKGRLPSEQFQHACRCQPTLSVPLPLPGTLATRWWWCCPGHTEARWPTLGPAETTRLPRTWWPLKRGMRYLSSMSLLIKTPYLILSQQKLFQFALLNEHSHRPPNFITFLGWDFLDFILLSVVLLRTCPRASDN